MFRKNRKAKKICGLEIGSLKHAFRSEMPQIVHWTSIFAFALVVGVQMSQGGKLFV